MVFEAELIESVSKQLKDRLTDLNRKIGGNLSTSHEEGNFERGGNDRGDESNHELQINLDLTRANRDSDELKLVEGALERLKNGEFGYCIDCDKKISKQRLIAVPIAKRCIECQIKHENDRDERDSTPSL